MLIDKGLHYLLSSFSLCWREFTRFYRQKSRIAGVIGSPLVFWFLIGSGLGGSFRHPNAPPTIDYLEYFFPGTIVLIVLFTAIFSSISIIEDRREGFLQSVMVAPVNRGSIVMGKVLGGTLLSLIQGLILLILTPFLGISLSISAVLLVMFVICITAFALGGLGFFIAWKMDSAQGFHAVMNLFLIPLWLLSGALFPSSGASSWIGTVMAVNPLTYGIAALRQALYPEGHMVTLELNPFLVNLLIMTGFAILTFMFSVFAVRKQP